MSNELANKFWRDIKALQTEAVDGLAPVRVAVVSESGGEVTVTRYDDDSGEPDVNTHPRLIGFRLDTSVDAYTLPLGNNQLLILGSLDNGETHFDLTPIAMHLDRALHVHEDTTVDGALAAGDSFLTSLTTDFGLFANGQTWLNDNTYIKNADSPIFMVDSQASSDTASTSSTVNLSVAIQVSLTLGDGTAGDGTWDVFANGSVALRNSAGVVAKVAVGIDGNDGLEHTTPVLDTTLYTRCAASHERTGLTGNRSILVSVKFRSNTANTTFAANPEITVIAKRVS